MWPFKKKAKSPTYGRLVIPHAVFEAAKAKYDTVAAVDRGARAVIEKIEKVIHDFAKTVEAQGDPLAFYDTSRLAHSKELIRQSLIFVIKFTQARQPKYAERARVMLDALPQYQENVGTEPVVFMPSMEGLSAEQLAAAVTAREANGEKARWDNFNKIAGAERAANARTLT